MLMVGDIGGTKTELAVYSSITTLSVPVADAIFPSAQYQSLEEIVRSFQEQFDVPVDRACFGIAGPVEEGEVTTTNLPWVVKAASLKEELNLRSVLLLNDLEAQASAVPFLQAADLRVLNRGDAIKAAPLAVVAPGTGLGEAFLTWDGQHYIAHTSEGGHADFAPTNELQVGLLRYLQPRLDHVSYEWVCSGRGIPNVYAYLKDSGYAKESQEVAEQLARAKDHTPVIVEAAMDPASPDPLCVATIDLFVSILGAEAGNVALKILPRGGVYIGGGIPPRILPFLQKPLFLQAFMNKGRLAEILHPIPVYVILNRKIGLLGAAYRGFAEDDVNKRALS
jgi:glucokinase